MTVQNRDKLLIFAVVFLLLLAIIVTTDSSSTKDIHSHDHHDHSPRKHEEYENDDQSQQPEPPSIISPKKSSAATSHHHHKHILPDFQSPADFKPDADFVQLYRHFHHHDVSSAFVYPKPLVAHYVRQLHHGIYQIKANMNIMLGKEKQEKEKEVTFAFKTECRPASKWHGQQGYTEILVNWVVKKVFGSHRPHHKKKDTIDDDDQRTAVPYPIGAFTPGAVGGIVEIPEEFQKNIHRDGCGYLTEEQVSTMYPSSSTITSSTGGKLMIGAVLQWKPQHKDDAIPTSKFLQPWRLTKQTDKKSSAPSTGSAAFNILKKIESSSSKSSVLQMSDIFVLDYIVGNEDRLEKNWFKDEKNRFIAMDNGWALAGLNYQGSVCDLDLQNLRCPPLFRGLAKSECKSGMLINCRFRRATIESVKRFIAEIESNNDDVDENNKLVKKDPLLKYLSQFYGGGEFVKKKKKSSSSSSPFRLWSEALARYVDSCTRSSMKDNNRGDGDEVLEKVIRQGLLARSKKLLDHVKSVCVARFGEDQVLL